MDAPAQPRLEGRRITLCVTGSIAAFKAPVIARRLRQEGAELRVVLSRSAREFIGPATFAGITGQPVERDMFDPAVGGELHLRLGRDSDLVLVAPATADLISRMAAGRADDTMAASLLCARAPVLLAPAMHPSMWAHPATVRNVALLDADSRVAWVGPVRGEVATGEVGVGRMAEPEAIVAAAIRLLVSQDLRGRHVVVTAGPTLEDLDPVRFIGNRSSGKMGFALAERAAQRGARVTLVAGPVSLPTPHGVDRIDVRSALELREALRTTLGPSLGGADAVVMAAAVADYRPRERADAKRKRDSATLTLELVQNPDVLAELGQARRSARPVLVGFALETASDAELESSARTKLEHKRVDLVVANAARDALEGGANRATLVSATGAVPLGVLSKGDLADRIWDEVRRRLPEVGS